MLAPTLNPPYKISDISHHCRIQFSEPNEPSIFFNSQFDSGNLAKVTRNSYDDYSIWTASDAEGYENEGYPKSWFYFQVGGFGKRNVKFSIHRVHFLWAMSSRNHLYRPVFRIKERNVNKQHENEAVWKRLPHQIQSISTNSQQQLVLKFDFYFSENIQSVSFAFTYPYSHEQCHNDVIDLGAKFQNDEQIFLKDYELCRSYEGRAVDMLMISSHQGKENYQNIKTDETFTLGSKKLTKFRDNKPIIFISARVHPIETPSSYTMKGIINFLTNKQDYRAHLLRKYFVFILVPMLNPDGVSNGFCRMDCLNQNLNRYYNNPDPKKQSSCYSVMKLCQHFNKDERLFMYLDLHAHPANKGNFIFGNAIFDYIQQVQSQLFPKILSQNCINFQFEQCNFSRKHMKAKDRYEDMNKQGCGRVVFYKQFGLTHSYTLQCGYHCNKYNNELKQQQSKNKIFIARFRKNERNENIYDNFQDAFVQQKQEDMEVLLQMLKQKRGNNNFYNFKSFKNVQDQLDNIRSQFYSKEIVFFEQETFYNLGRNICISMLDIWNKNPYSRVENINQQRKEIAEKQARLDRFRKEQVGIRAKQKRIVQLIQTQFYGHWHRKNIFNVALANGILKNQYRTYQNIKKIDKSVTVTEIRQEIPKNKVEGSRSIKKINKTLNKQQKRVGIVQPNLESIKVISGPQFSRRPASLESVIGTKAFLKPSNIRAKNPNVQNK